MVTRVMTSVPALPAQSSPKTAISPSKRRDMDVTKLMMSDYDVTLNNDCTDDLYVIFHGPPDSPYAGGSWKVHVELPEGYPYKSPSIGFCNRMFHPNVDEMSGTVCLDVINQTWSPMFDLLNVFEVFLPQLLLYPNPTDPLNGEAAALMMRSPEQYAARIRDCVAKYGQAAAEAAANDDDDADEDEDEDEE